MADLILFAVQSGQYLWRAPRRRDLEEACIADRGKDYSAIGSPACAAIKTWSVTDEK